MSELSSSPAEVARFTRRLQIHEDPAVIEKLREYAQDSGRSVAAEDESRSPLVDPRSR